MVDVAFKLLIDNIEFVDNAFKLLNIVVDVAFKLFIDNVELVDKLFKLIVVAYTVKSGLLITVVFQSDWKLVGLFARVPQVLGNVDGLFITVVSQSDWKLVGLLITFEYRIFVNPFPLPFKRWLESIVKASVLFVKNLMVFCDGL